jgi:predicted nucleic acid-binding Zn ribbon protein
MASPSQQRSIEMLLMVVLAVLLVWIALSRFR